MDMNKNVMLPLVALIMVLAMVGAASAADEVTTLNKLEIRGSVQDLDGAQTEPIEWNATNFAAFWYDIDEDLMTETLIIEANSLDGNVTGGQRTIAEDHLIYHTEPVAQEYELYEDGGMQLEAGVDNRTHYFVEGFMAERYVAINNQADTLCKLLVEFEDDDKKTLSTGEAWDLGSGFALTAQQIDLEGEKVWLTLEKDGKELDSEVISTGGATLDKNDSVYTCTQDIGSEDDVPMFSCHVDAVFRGTDTNIVQLQYVFLMDNDVLEIDSGDEFGIMEADVTTNYINLTNEEDTVDLSQDNKEHIMGDIYFKTADNGGTGEDNRLRFYPYVEYTIGEIGEVTEDEGAATATATVTETVGENVTGPGEEGEGVGEGEGEGEAVATATATTEAEAEPTETEAEPTATKKKVPGFEALFAISGLLAVAYLVLRQRD